MRVVELELRQVRITLRRPIKHASHTRTETDNLVARCVLGDGSVGYGEGVPREYVTGETVDSAFELLAKSDLQRQLVPCQSFEEVVAAAERIQLASVPGDDRRCHGNAARCAVELAYLDAFGRALGEPLMNVTRTLTPNLYEPREWVHYSGVITSAKGWKARALAWGMRLLGFHQVKVKVGIAGQNDAQRLASIRRRLGATIDIRVDANEAWSLTEVADKIRELEPFGISSVEQPVPHELITGMKHVREQLKTPIMLDESLCSMIDAQSAQVGGYCDSFNLRLSKCGGFIPSLRLAEFAAKQGLSYQLGCQVGETAILSAAGRQFATSVKGIRYLEGSYDRHLVREALGTENITFGRGGWAPMLLGCGLGVGIDAARLDAVTVRKERLIRD
jgi:L-Ala-D/L-Glu epimerase